MQLHAMHTLISLMQPSAHKYAKDICKATQGAMLSFAIMLTDCPPTIYEICMAAQSLTQHTKTAHISNCLKEAWRITISDASQS